MKSLHTVITGVCATAIMACVIWLVWLSLDNPIRADLSMLHYSGWLMAEKHALLYRDILEINFPAPYLLHQGLNGLLGHSAGALHWVDIATMATLFAISARILYPLSRPAAFAAPALFLLYYLLRGAEFTLERDYLLLLPVSAAFLLALQERWHVGVRAVGIGCLCGVACGLKPNAIVAAPALYAVLWLHAPALRATPVCLRHALLASGAFLLSFLPPFLLLWQQGVMDDFLAIYRGFLPIYTSARSDLYHYNNTHEYGYTLLKNYLIYGGLAAVLSALGLSWARWQGSDQRRLLSLAIMAFAFTWYEVIAGKFWVSHMIPSVYWTSLCFALLLTSPCTPSPSRHAIALVCMLLFSSVAAALGWLSFQDMQRYQYEQTHGKDFSEQVGRFLQQQHLTDNDTVQVLDMAGDGQAALLLAGTRSATRFLIDGFLYLEPQHPVTQGFRREFLQTLKNKKPAFIVYFERYLHPGGGNRLNEFHELAQFLSEHYVVDTRVEAGYTIFRRKDRPATALPSPP